MPALRVGAVLLLLLAALVPATAHATTTARFTPGETTIGPDGLPDQAAAILSVRGDRRANVISIRRSARAWVVTDAAGVRARGRCRQVTRSRVNCPRAQAIRRVFGGAGRDRITGQAGRLIETLSGGSGDDVIRGTGFASGGAGDDVLYARPGDGWLRGGPGDDRLVGIARQQVLIGGAGRDVLRGAGGDDVLIGDDEGGLSRAADVLDGGAGLDRVDYRGRSGAVTIDLTGAATSGAAGEGDTVRSVEDAYAGSGPDTLIGTAAPEVFTGGPGGDTISGAGGDDVFFMEDETPGGDRIDGGAGLDEASYILTAERVVVDLADPGPDGVQRAPDTLTGVENVSSGSGDDVLTGDGGPNVLDGGGGSDTLTGGGGADRLLGGAADDLLRALDGVEDRVDCGEGSDRFSADGFDRTTACEAPEG